MKKGLRQILYSKRKNDRKRGQGEERRGRRWQKRKEEMLKSEKRKGRKVGKKGKYECDEG